MNRLRDLVDIGRPLPDVEIEVRDDQGRRVANGEVGEIMVRTPRVMKGYAGSVDGARDLLVVLASGCRRLRCACIQSFVIKTTQNSNTSTVRIQHLCDARCALCDVRCE